MMSAFRLRRAGVTQSVECQLPKLDVAGSSPVSRSILQGLTGFSKSHFWVCVLFVYPWSNFKIASRLDSSVKCPYLFRSISNDACPIKLAIINGNVIHIPVVKHIHSQKVEEL